MNTEYFPNCYYHIVEETDEETVHICKFKFNTKTDKTIIPKIKISMCSKEIKSKGRLSDEALTLYEIIQESQKYSVCTECLKVAKNTLKNKFM